MAERRMFAKTIIDSDAFLDMPLSAQSLYFHLSMRADDEGFINNPKKIQRMIGASDDDLKLLIAKSFIINFESGIIVIKHWKIHNYIRGDRLQKTQYQEERQLLEVKDNGAYTLGSGLKEISSTEKRQIAYKESELPYCFTYKIRRAFDGKQCPICGGTMHSSSRTTMPTIQHNIPISKGGKHVIENISVVCESCNTSIKDKETGALNNADVIRTWDAILIAEEQKIDWFYNTELLDTIDVSHMSVTCQSHVSIGKDSIGKDSIGKDNINNPPYPPLEGGDNEPSKYNFDKHTNLENAKYVLNYKYFSEWEYILNTPGLWGAIKDWMEYKDAKKPKNRNRYINIKSLCNWLSRVVNTSNACGADAVIKAIEDSIGEGYVGVLWDSIKKKESSKRTDWSNIH